MCGGCRTTTCGRFQLALFILVMAVVADAFAETITLTPMMDNTIFGGVKGGGNPQDYTVDTCGAGPDMFSGATNDGFPRRALLQFDIAGSLPAGAIINSNHFLEVFLYRQNARQALGVKRGDPIRVVVQPA